MKIMHYLINKWVFMDQKVNKITVGRANFRKWDIF